jgi:hypothetical protein
MNIHLIRSAEFDSERFWEVVNLLHKYPGILQFKTREEPLVMHDDVVREQTITAEAFHTQEKDSAAVNESRRVEVVTWNTIFSRCSEYRRKNDIGTNEFVVLLTDYSNDKNWFAAGDPRGERNLFVQTRYWDYYSGSDLRYPVAYHTVTGILKKLMFRDYNDLNAHWHERPIGCMLDFCRNKKEISLKLRTADICPDCLKLINDRSVDHKLVQQVFEVLDGIRAQMVYKARFVINRQPPQLNFEGRNRKLIFPELGDLEVRLTPLEKTVYLFFFSHPEGVALNSIFEHEDEFMDIYSSLSNADSREVMVQRVNDLIDPLSNSISEKISRIRRKFSEALGEEMASDFIITGANAEPRYIPYAKVQSRKSTREVKPGRNRWLYPE